eukprot:1149815-Pelagomonas_calceolata.AAC.4
MKKEDPGTIFCLPHVRITYQLFIPCLDPETQLAWPLQVVIKVEQDIPWRLPFTLGTHQLHIPRPWSLRLGLPGLCRW